MGGPESVDWIGAVTATLVCFRFIGANEKNPALISWGVHKRERKILRRNIFTLDLNVTRGLNLTHLVCLASVYFHSLER